MASTEKKLVKSKSGYRMVTVDEKIASPFTLEEPQWISDNDCSHCQNMDCQLKFDFLKRKHHCRRCGRCYCGNCTSQLIALPRMCFIDPVRHCAICYKITVKENEFFDKQIKTLTSGGHFRPHSALDNDQSSFICQLSSDHRTLEFDGGTGNQDNINLKDIESVQIAAAVTDQQGNYTGKGIAICYKNSIGNSVTLKMDVDNDNACKQSMTWVAAMQKAFKMMHESRRRED